MTNEHISICNMVKELADSDQEFKKHITLLLAGFVPPAESQQQEGHNAEYVSIPNGDSSNISQDIEVISSAEVPKSELEASKQLAEASRNVRVNKRARNKATTISKRCPCGREEQVVRGGVLDNQKFICNKCLTGR